MLFSNNDFAPEPAVPMEATFDERTAPMDPLLNAEVECMQWKQHQLSIKHERFGHLSFSVLKLMARAELIPKELTNVPPPTCPGCNYGKAHRKPWRRKGIKNCRTIKVATAPGQVVSVDQLISPTPGFIPTHCGSPTFQHYWGATVFIDHFSDFSYVHLMIDMDANATVEAKLEFE
jgi:hypothetical protein